MTTIIPAAKLAAQALGKQKRREGVTYRLFKYVVQEPVEDGLLLYNALTLELVLLSPEEAEGMMRSDELLAKWFLVPENHDDRKFSDQLHAIAASMQKPAKHITFYKVFTTTHCNARCYYCFEQNFKNKKTMTPETAEQLVRYITEHSGGKKVALEWFGGEPLVNQQAIDIVSKGLADAGISYSSSIITNGYLFDAENIRKAKDLWHLDLAQITVDGTEETYNRIKNYVNTEGSPYQRVMNNIEALLDAGVRQVNVTMNVSEENWQDLLRLSDELAARFGGRKGFHVILGTVSDVDAFQPGQTDGTMTCSDVKYQKGQKVQKRLEQLGLYLPGRLPHRIHGNACIADNESTVTVLPDGALGFCGDISEGETFGTVYSPERDEAMIAAWKERVPLTAPACADCLCYPQCVRLKKCPCGACSTSQQEWRKSRLRSQMLYEYRTFMRQKAKDC